MALFRFFCFFLFLGLPLLTVHAEEEKKLPLPRFASLRAKEVNMRVGPGTEYEITWIYKRKNMPVEILEEFDTWRKIRDWQGTVGWVHRNMLSAKRTAIIMQDQRILYRDPDPQSKAKAYLQPGVIVTIEECQPDWCEVEAPERIEGWVHRKDVWGIYPEEHFPQ